MKTLAGFTASPVALLLTTFFPLYFLAVYVVRHSSWRDPGSVFFNSQTAYKPRYSVTRQQQADHLIQTASGASASHSSSGGSVGTDTLCVGIISVARENARYLRTTVGSLLEGLSGQERDGIYLIVFIANTDPTMHPAYTEAWLPNLTDQVLTYNSSDDNWDHLVSLEEDRNILEKGLLDYNYLLKACSALGSAYIAMFEDDVIAMDGWYHRTLAGIKQAKEKTARLKGHPDDFLYLRLFYTEEFLGWNSEDWPKHALWSLFFILGSGVGLHWLSSCVSSLKSHVRAPLIFTVSIVCMPLAIALFFALGRITVLPLPEGVNLMSNYGCCSQGFVFPHQKSIDLISFYERSKIGFVDMLTEDYAGANNELRWALTPSVIQHVGRRSSKEDGLEEHPKNHLTIAEKMWNFEFEMNDRDTLRKQHDLVINQHA